MLFRRVSLWAIATLSSSAFAQAAVANHNDPTQAPSAPPGPYVSTNLDPEYSEDVYEDLFPQFLDEEIIRKNADFAKDRMQVLQGAVQSAEDDGLIKKANLLRRIQTWKEQSGQLNRRSVNDDDDDDDNDTPDAEDITWVNEFLAGQPVDENLLWQTSDLIGDDTDDGVMDTPDENENTFFAALAKAHTQHAFARARLRASAVSNTSAVLEQSDADWAAAFLNGQSVDENMIFNSTDLDAPIDDDNTESLATPATANLALEKRKHYKHPPKNALQVLRRAERAMRCARHRAQRRKRQAAKKAAHKKKQKQIQKQKQKQYHHVTHHSKNPLPWYHPKSHSHSSGSGGQHQQHKQHHKQHNHKSSHHNKHKGGHIFCFNQYWMCPVHCKQLYYQGSNVDCIQPGGGN